MYLTRAAEAREHARHAALKSERIFYGRMEQRWLGLAACTAVVERVDLFLHTLQSTDLPHDVCTDCHGIMAIEVVEATRCREIYTLRCRKCGGTEFRTVMRYTVRGVGQAPDPTRPAAVEAPPAVAQSLAGARSQD